MLSARRWLTRGLDVLAALIVLGALFAFFVVPRMAENRIVPAPPVSLATLGGGRFSVDGQRGRLTYLDFWATWCTPCRQSIPLIQRFARLHPEVDVVSVDVGEPAALVAAFVRTHPMERVALDPDQIAGRAFGVSDYPTMVVIDPQGNQRGKWLGFNPQIESQMAAAEARYLPKHTSWIAPAAAAEPARPPTLVLEDEPNSLNTIRNTPFGWLLAPMTQGYLFLVDDRGELVPDAALTLPTRANG
ncbi:MAG TPA: TlpA disulfide reductase family protein, partial [Candidatus Lustribacter sp.]|nr:TlpA disulfide reductase family protein [Candidatus Lustribacter sp.]